MVDQPNPGCPHEDLTESLVDGTAIGEVRQRAQRHLEHCERCRESFSARTAHLFPSLPSYTVVEQVGKGGFGVVYRAVHHAKERTEALKILFSRTPVQTAYFENEVHLIAKLRHPNVATLYDAQLSAPPLYYTMEFVEGQRLNDYLKEKDVSLPDRVQIIRAVALAVGYAHTQGVVHRDIKPQNILVDHAGQPHIVDFGIAKRLGLVEQPSDASPTARAEGPVGTIGYIAPEQVAGGQVDARADIYALGALLFHCLTGEPARAVKDPAHVLQILRLRHFQRPEDLSAIITCCTAQLPDARYSSCENFARDLDNYLEGRQIVARGDASLFHQFARLLSLLFRRHPHPVRAMLLVLVAIGLTATYHTFAARWLAPSGGGGQTAIITFGPDALAAVQQGLIGAGLAERGLSVSDRPSWRLLFGELMHHLVDAEPKVVVWDVYANECVEAYDGYFIEGIRALSTVAPVIMGCERFDLTGQPLMCAAIRDAIHAYGCLSVAPPIWQSNEYLIPFCVQRGFESPIPSLSIAALAAARFPDHVGEVVVNPGEIELRYRKRNADVGKSRYRAEADRFSVAAVGEVPEDDACLLPDDRLPYFRVPRQPPELWAERTHAYQDVLRADARQLRRWFGGKVVVIGQTLPFQDYFLTKQGGGIFGCFIHAQAIEALLVQSGLHPFSPFSLACRICLWCAAAGILVNFVRTPRQLSLNRIFVLCAAVFCGGVMLAIAAAGRITEVWAIEVAIAASALMTAGGAAYFHAAVRERQLQFSPQTVTLATGAADLPTTVLAVDQ